MEEFIEINGIIDHDLGKNICNQINEIIKEKISRDYSKISRVNIQLSTIGGDFNTVLQIREKILKLIMHKPRHVFITCIGTIERAGLLLLLDIPYQDIEFKNVLLMVDKPLYNTPDSGIVYTEQLEPLREYQNNVMKKLLFLYLDDSQINDYENNLPVYFTLEVEKAYETPANVISRIKKR